MKIEEIKRRVDLIKERADDPESAHSQEDKLYLDFIKYISKLSSPLGKKALAVLETQEIDFPRWCA